MGLIYETYDEFVRHGRQVWNHGLEEAPFDQRPEIGFPSSTTFQVTNDYWCTRCHHLLGFTRLVNCLENLDSAKIKVINYLIN